MQALANKALKDRLLARPDFPHLLNDLQISWRQEQQRRDEFWEHTHDDVKAEFIHGRGIMHSPATMGHTETIQNIYDRLKPYVKSKGLGKVFTEKAMIRLTRNDYEPDIVFWKKTKADAFSGDQYIFPAPDFVVEVLSKNTRRVDKGLKFQDYEAHGILEYWIADPKDKSLEQFVMSDEKYVSRFQGKSGRVESVAVSGFGLEVSEIFS